jgi:hypothetical protein
MRPVAAVYGRREKIISGNFDEILAHSCAASCSSEFARWGIWRHVAAVLLQICYIEKGAAVSGNPLFYIDI